MADGGDIISAATVGAVDEIGRDVWNRLANPASGPFNPFASFEFLDALEQSGSVSPAAGWTPAHLVLQLQGDVVGVAPLYLKSHSQGEYVFDHHWADAYERAGGRYYPKLLCAVPFTPVVGPRLMAPGPLRPSLAQAMSQIATNAGIQSVHVNFIEAELSADLAQAGFLPRCDLQYHWFNRGYRDYSDFLATLSSRKRKMLRRERRDSVAGLTIRKLAGAEIKESHWDAFWAFYQETGSRKWGRPYLTRKFFSLIGQSLGERIILILAERNGAPIAGALNFLGSDAIYGRYWGCVEDRPFLHFELCYHQAIDEAIARGLSRVEAGAQGEHKLARGYEPVMTHSAHWISDQGFRASIERYLEQESRQMEYACEMLGRSAPYRKD